MNKELTPLEELKVIKSFQNKRTFDVTYDNGDQKHFETKTIGELFPNEIKKIETELKETDKLRQVNCELLEQKNALREERDKYKKTLEILNNKEVDVGLIMETPNVAHYNRHFEYSNIIYLRKKLTEEEYDFLKEVFGNV